MSESFTEPMMDNFICDVGAFLKTLGVLQDGPEIQAMLTFFNTHGYSHITDDLLLSFSNDFHSLDT